MMKSLLDSVIKASPQVSWFAELCVQTCPPTHVHVHTHMHTLLCPPRPVSRADDMHSICSLENRSTQHSPCLCEEGQGLVVHGKRPFRPG